MKKIIALLMMLFLLGCANTDTKDTKAATTKAITALMSAEEKQQLIAGKKIQIPAITLSQASHGLLGDGLRNVVGKVKGKSQGVEYAMSNMIKYPNAILISINSLDLLKAIEYMGETEKGRQILAQGRYAFLKTELTGANFVNKADVEKLSKKYGFRYYVED